MSRSAISYPAMPRSSRVSLYQPPFPRIPHASTRSALKRLIDMVGAVVGLAILSLLYVPVAISIRLDSAGPILYSQERFGLQGKPFRIWKFRSMVSNADELKGTIINEAQGLIFKNAADPRITKVGQFLRKTSLDEFPQFWNVLKGEMSLVGTRPPTADEVQHYSDRNWKRLDVRPGLTGEWQVSGRSAIKDFEDIVELDLHYQRNWSAIYDIKLIVKTVTTILSGQSSAY
jgi:lipopolysaccharide/colanic/teichoic acid biosynthesis glycosyltransferase